MISVSSDWESNSTLPVYKTSVQDHLPSSFSTNHDDVDSDCSSIEFDDTDATPIGGKMKNIKLDNMIRISGCNPNGINSQNIRSQLQHSMDLDIDVQCYSETNVNLLKSNLRHKLHEAVLSMDRNSKATWSNSDVPCDSNFKPGGTCIINRGSTKSRIKSSGNDSLGRWSWQLLTGEGPREVLIISIYQCCSSNSKDARNTAYRQQ